MKQVFQYWKQGWMFIAMLLIFNVLMAIVVVPVGFLTRAFGLDKGARVVIQLFTLVVFAPLIGCWVLNTFDRLGTSKYSQARMSGEGTRGVPDLQEKQE